MPEHTTDPVHDRDAETPPLESGSAATPGGSSRRGFLAGAGAGALGVAAVGTLATATAAAAGTAAPTGTEDFATPADVDALVAYVSDVMQGEITLFRGGDEVVVQDRALARALTNRFDQAARPTDQER